MLLIHMPLVGVVFFENAQTGEGNSMYFLAPHAIQVLHLILLKSSPVEQKEVQQVNPEYRVAYEKSDFLIRVCFFSNPLP